VTEDNGARVGRLEARLDQIDATGTRGVAVLAVQLQEVAKDLAKVEAELAAHRGEHNRAESARASNRRWAVGLVVAAVAAVDGPLVTLLFHAHG
jgi:hypothetical protein